METMRCILAILSTALLVQAGPPDLPNMKEITECRSTFPIDDSNMMNMLSKGVLLDESNENARCFVQCCMEKAEKVLNATGTYDVALAKKNTATNAKCLFGPPGTPIPAQNIIDVAIDECAKTSGTGKCMTNYKIWICLYKKFH